MIKNMHQFFAWHKSGAKVPFSCKQFVFTMLYGFQTIWVRLLENA